MAAGLSERAPKGAKSQKGAILELLSDGRWHKMFELHGICWRYSARLHDLRKDGHAIESQRIDGVWCFRLAPEPGQLGLL